MVAVNGRIHLPIGDQDGADFHLIFYLPFKTLLMGGGAERPEIVHRIEITNPTIMPDIARFNTMAVHQKPTRNLAFFCPQTRSILYVYGR